jgi:hypothetical protein
MEPRPFVKEVSGTHCSLPNLGVLRSFKTKLSTKEKPSGSPAVTRRVDRNPIQLNIHRSTPNRSLWMNHE